MRKIVLLLVIALASLVSACTPIEIVLTATPSPATEVAVTSAPPTPTQEVATVPPSPTVSPACDNPNYSDSDCPVNESLMLPPCFQTVQEGRTFHYPNQFGLGQNGNNGINSDVGVIPFANCRYEATTLDLYDGVARDTYAGYWEVDTAFWAGEIILRQDLTAELPPQTCYIVRVPYSLRVPPLNTGSDFAISDVNTRLWLFDRENSEWEISYYQPMVLRDDNEDGLWDNKLADGELLWLVRNNTESAPIYMFEIDVRWAKFITGAFIRVYAIEWFQVACPSANTPETNIIDF